MSIALAYFLTWTTYGTRLHGDDRGSVDRANDAYGAPLLAPHPARVRYERSIMRWPEYVMSDRAWAVVDRAIRDHATHRAWTMLSLSVRTNHVHVVAAAPKVHPDLVMEQFKQWGTRRLREASLVQSGRAVWTVHGSTKWLWTNDDINDACHYVNDLQ